LLDAASFREIVSGRRRGPIGGSLRGVLSLAEIPYRWAMRWRNRAFDSGRSPIHDVGIPVVSVGNLTMGGTGKTPMVEWLARWFMDRGLKVAIVSRGYKSKTGALNDEGLELSQKLPGTAHLQNPDRVAAAHQAIEQYGSEIIILDDGFQHRRIHRDFDMVLLDALEPFGYGHVFPRGMLREPVEGLARAHIAVLTRADMLSPAERAKIRQQVLHHAPQIAWAECRHAPRALLTADGHEESLDTFRGRRAVAFCGLGNPAGFRHTLNECGCNIIAWREFPDHFAYDRANVDELERWIESQNAEVALCTHKDLVKLNVNELAGRPLRAITVGLEFLSGQPQLESGLDAMLRIFEKSKLRKTAAPPPLEPPQPQQISAPQAPISNTGTWSTVEVAGKPCDVFEPTTPNPHGFVVIYLHGLRGQRLIDKPIFASEFARYGLRVIAPITGPSWWADRICPTFDKQLTPERHVLDNVLTYIRNTWGAAPPQIALLGTSMGGQGALRLSFKHPNKFPVVAAISPAIDYQIRWNEGDETLPLMYTDQEDVRQDTATLHVHPLNWPRHIWLCCDPADDRWHESAERLRSKLAAIGIPHEYDLKTSAGGHSFTYYNHMAPAALQFIATQLEHERLRVV
jgi:tetraacyldisaccharide 4'-kinase